jgi:glycosyltransferase involved in cell wall biosynthesis
MIEAAEGELLIAVKPYLASFGVALLAGECRRIPVILDIDDLDLALGKRQELNLDQSVQGLRDPGSITYLQLLSKLTGAASAITVASTLLQKRFGGALVPHGCLTELFNPTAIDREKARRRFGFSGPVVLFPGTRRTHKGLKPLAKAVAQIPGACLAVLSRPDDFSQPEWSAFPLIKIPVLPYAELAVLLAAADVVAIPQLDTEAARHQMPMKAYDAMAMAKPIVASTVSDLPLVLEGCARLVAPGDVEGLKEAISELLNSPGEARVLGAKARERCLENYSMKRIGEQLFQVVNDVLASRRQ